MSTDPPASVSASSSGILVERDDGIRIVRLTSDVDALAYRASFAGVYQTVFAEAPYNERFYPSEAQAVLRAHLESPYAIVLIAFKGIAQGGGGGLDDAEAGGEEGDEEGEEGEEGAAQRTFDKLRREEEEVAAGGGDPPATQPLRPALRTLALIGEGRGLGIVYVRTPLYVHRHMYQPI